MAYTEKVIAELKAIDDQKLRVVENDRGRFVDLREYIESPKFTGFTRRGVRLSLEEFEQLLAQASEIRALLLGAGGGAKQQAA